MRAIIDRPVFLLLLLLGCVIGAMPSYAHPMGNFSVNHYSRITLTSDGIEIRYILDLAEIPTYQEIQDGTIVAKVDNPRVLAFIAERGEEFGRRLCLGIDGKLIQLRLISYDVIFPPGAGGLPTMKMGFTYRAAYPAGAGGAAVNLNFEDQNFDGHRGWKEIVVIAPQGMLIHASAPAWDRSDELSNYPTDLLISPPQDLTASIQFRLPSSAQPSALQGSNVVHSPTSAAGRISQVIAGDRKKTSSLATVPRHIPALQSSVRTATSVEPGRAIMIHAPPVPQTPTVIPAHLKTNQQATPRSAFTELITTTRVNFWFLIAAALTAFGLGALHALEPGHGKTIVAAYLVGSRGTARHAALLGIIVTVSHTAGVFALGAITLYASRYIVPERLYPWLGVSSGLFIAGLGGYLFLRRWTGAESDHSHADGQPHSHWFTRKKKRPTLERQTALQPTPVRGAAESISLVQLFVLGITGGIIPCPAALVVLLSALTLHRIGLGLFLIVAFSLGLAAVLVSFGTLMVYARQFVTRFKMDDSLIARWLPLVSAALVTVLGAAITVQTLAATGLHIQFVSRADLGPFLFVVGLGLILGVRHSTDPDHVIAVSTIVSKQRSIRHAALIGTFWGLGHTLTIFVVGSLIILFGVVIPPRLGLSMEFGVALMLIILGALNLSGLMRKFTEPVARWRNTQKIPQALVKAKLENHTKLLTKHYAFASGAYVYMRPLLIGIVHGLAGSAAVALLVLSTIRSPVWATVYLLIFGAGTMLGMMFMTTALAVPLAYAGNRFAQVSRCLGLASGVLSLSFGAFLVYQLGVLGGLFTSHPHWTPQ
jgi:nickel/cobalt exporter